MDLNLLVIDAATPLSDILEKIKSLREQKGREKDVLALIDRALGFGHDFVINLFWEEALTFQHLLMTELSKARSSQDFVRK